MEAPNVLIGIVYHLLEELCKLRLLIGRVEAERLSLLAPLSPCSEESVEKVELK